MSDFSTYTATQIAEWMSQGTIDAAPANLYVALFDDTDTEVSGDFANDRPSTTAGSDWNIINTNDFENANEIDFGEAAVDVTNIQDVAIYDDTLANGGNQIARYTLTDAPFDVSAGSRAFFDPGQLSFDVEDTSE
jgi:hypothetical protein